MPFHALVFVAFKALGKTLSQSCPRKLFRRNTAVLLQNTDTMENGPANCISRAKGSKLRLQHTEIQSLIFPGSRSSCEGHVRGVIRRNNGAGTAGNSARSVRAAEASVGIVPALNKKSKHNQVNAKNVLPAASRCRHTHDVPPTAETALPRHGVATARLQYFRR